TSARRSSPPAPTSLRYWRCATRRAPPSSLAAANPISASSSSRRRRVELSHLEPRRHAGRFVPDEAALDKPLAGIVRHERDARGLARPRDDGVEPERLPAVVEIVEQPGMVAM